MRRRNHGQCPQPPTSTADGGNFLRDNEHFHSGQNPLPTTLPVNDACSGSLLLTLPGVMIMRKIAVGWTCGRTFSVCQLRERNSCSCKCRARAGFEPAPRCLEGINAQGSVSGTASAIKVTNTSYDSEFRQWFLSGAPLVTCLSGYTPLSAWQVAG